jgi:hypothetical protein
MVVSRRYVVDSDPRHICLCPIEHSRIDRNAHRDRSGDQVSSMAFSTASIRTWLLVSGERIDLTDNLESDKVRASKLVMLTAATQNVEPNCLAIRRTRRFISPTRSLTNTSVTPCHQCQRFTRHARRNAHARSGQRRRHQGLSGVQAQLCAADARGGHQTCRH